MPLNFGLLQIERASILKRHILPCWLLTGVCVYSVIFYYVSKVFLLFSNTAHLVLRNYGIMSYQLHEACTIVYADNYR